MKRRIVALFAGVAVASAMARADAQARAAGMPQLRKQGTATQLVVDGAPFPILGGELGDSSASSLNGDQTHQGRHVRLPPGEFTIQRVRLYRYR